MDIDAVNLSTEAVRECFRKLRAGDSVSLSAYVYTARDAAHKKIRKLMNHGQEPPFPINGAMIY